LRIYHFCDKTLQRGPSKIKICFLKIGQEGYKNPELFVSEGKLYKNAPEKN
jgi:hypothetical protein